MGRPEEALAYCRKALAIDPDHRGAHEYIGETCLLLGRPAGARKQLAILADDCWMGCPESDELKEAVANCDAKHRRRFRLPGCGIPRESRHPVPA